MFSKIPTISIISLKLLIKPPSRSPEKPYKTGLNTLNQNDPYELSKIIAKQKQQSNDQKQIYAILKLKEQQIFVTQCLPVIYGKQLCFDKGEQGLLENSNLGCNQSESNIQGLISTFQLVTVNRGLTNRHINEQYLCLQVWQYCQMELIGTYKIHLDLLKEGRTEYTSTFQATDNASQIKFSLKFQKDQPKGFSNHKVSPYNLNGYYHSPSHFDQNTQRGNSLSNKNQKLYNPEKKNYYENQYQTATQQLKDSNLYIPLRRIGSQQFKAQPSARISSRNYQNASFNNQGYTSKYSISKPAIERTHYFESKYSGLPSTRNNDIGNQYKKISIKNRNVITGNYRKNTESNIQSTLKL